MEPANGRPPRRILVVDDNQDAADSLAMLMKLRGFEALVAYDGQTALRIAESDKPSIVLLDIGLPGMDGCEVCRKMRERGLTDMRIIAMTGYGQESDRERSREAGFDVHAVKPVKIDDLLKLIEDA
ncbi:MAG: response regulator [Candidatus Binatia bacterium]